MAVWDGPGAAWQRASMSDAPSKGKGPQTMRRGAGLRSGGRLQGIIV